MIAVVRPHGWDFPLFLHVFGAIVLFGAVLATTALTLAGRGERTLREPSRSTFWTLLAAAIPAWIVMRVGAQWTYSKEGFTGDNDPAWLGIGFGAADAGLIILLLATGFAFWWQRSRKPVAGWVVTGLSALYLVLLAIAWLAMSGKWG